MMVESMNKTTSEFYMKKYSLNSLKSFSMENLQVFLFFKLKRKRDRESMYGVQQSTNCTVTTKHSIHATQIT